jgi:ATP-binding cassette subfamily B protein
LNILIKYLIRYKRLFLLGLLVLVIVDILELLSPLYIRGAIDDLVAGEFHQKWAIYYLLTALGSGLCRYAWRVFLIRGSMLSGRDLRQEYSEYLFKLSARFFDKNKVGDLMSLATNDIESVRMALGPGLLMSADAVFYLITVPCAMFLLSWKLSLIVLIPIVFVPWFVYRNEKAVKARYQKVQETFSDISALSQESLSGIRVIKGFAKEKIQTQRLKNLSQKYRTQSLDLSKVQTTFGPKLDLLTSLGWVLLLAAGGAMVLNGSLSIGTFVAFQRYIEKLIWPMVALSFAIIHYQRAIGSVERS